MLLGGYNEGYCDGYEDADNGEFPTRKWIKRYNNYCTRKSYKSGYRKGFDDRKRHGRRDKKKRVNPDENKPSVIDEEKV